jgi:hypothetical protein
LLTSALDGEEWLTSCPFTLLSVPLAEEAVLVPQLARMFFGEEKNLVPYCDSNPGP